MNSTLCEELLQRELDGSLSDVEQESLLLYLASHPKERELQKHLKAVAAAFKQAPVIDPPASLRANVMQSIRSRASARPEPQPSLWMSLTAVFDLFRSRPVMSAALGFAAGMLAIMPFTGQWSGPDLAPESQVSGTILAERAWPSGPAVDELNFTEGSVYGSVRLEVLVNRLILSVDVSSEEPVEIVMGYNMRRLWVSGLISREPGHLTFQSDEGTVSVSHSGNVKYLVAFDGGGDDISAFTLKVAQGDRLLFTGELSTRAK